MYKWRYDVSMFSFYCRKREKRNVKESNKKLEVVESHYHPPDRWYDSMIFLSFFYGRTITKRDDKESKSVQPKRQKAVESHDNSCSKMYNQTSVYILFIEEQGQIVKGQMLL